MTSVGTVVWLTGLPSAGKSTLARATATRAREQGRAVAVLDGDELRQALWPDLGFSKAHRDENVRRAGALAGLLAEQGLVVLVALVSPYEGARNIARGQAARFLEVFVSCSLSVCETRDVKGLYARARAGEIQGMTGIDDPYEPPTAPELVLRTEEWTVGECVERLMAALVELEASSAPGERA